MDANKLVYKYIVPPDPQLFLSRLSGVGLVRHNYEDTHPVLIVNPVMPKVDKVDNVCVFELSEPLKNLD